MSRAALRSLVSPSSFGSLRSAMRGRYRVPPASSMSTEPAKEKVTNICDGMTNKEVVFVYLLPGLFGFFWLGPTLVQAYQVRCWRREVQLAANSRTDVFGNPNGEKAEGMIQARE